MSAERRNVPAIIETAAPVKASSLRSTLAIPAAIADAGEHAARRFLEFFAANIRNKNTRMAYYRGACHFFAWVEQHQIGELADIEPIHVAAYYRNAFPISRKVQFAQIVIARIDILNQEYGEIRKRIIKEFFSDGVHCWKAERGCCI